MIDGTRIIERTASAHSSPLLLKQLLHTPMTCSRNQEIVYRDMHRFTYDDFHRRIKRLSSGLQAVGVKPGEAVAVLDWDSHRYLECYFGIPSIGAVLHCVNVRLSPEQVLFTMKHAEDTVALVHEDFVPLVAAIKDQLPSVRTWILMRDTDKQIGSSIQFACEYEELLAKGTDDFEFPDFDENSMATLFYTTGTTGDPKGVYFSHRQLVLHTMGLLVTVGSVSPKPLVHAGDVYMPITPLFHVHAWGMPYASTLLGLKQVYPGRYDPEMLLGLLLGEKVTVSHCVPTILQMLLSSPVVAQLDLSRWKVIIGGSSLPRGLARMAIERGIDIYSGYGMSETCPLLTISNLKPDMVDAEIEPQLDVRTAAGMPAPLVELRIVDPDMNDVAHDGQTAGEVVVRSPWLTQGYFKSPDKSEELWQGGYLHTGDVACMDSEGYVRITDRIKDVIKTGGEWVSSLQIESLLSQHPFVGEVAVVGVPDDKWGERPLAVIVPAGPVDDFPVDEVREFLMQFVDEGIISKYAVPDRIVIVPEIPKTSVGKLDKKEIRKRV